MNNLKVGLFKSSTNSLLIECWITWNLKVVGGMVHIRDDSVSASKNNVPVGFALWNMQFQFPIKFTLNMQCLQKHRSSWNIVSKLLSYQLHPSFWESWNHLHCIKHCHQLMSIPCLDHKLQSTTTNFTFTLKMNTNRMNTNRMIIEWEYK